MNCVGNISKVTTNENNEKKLRIKEQTMIDGDVHHEWLMLEKPSNNGDVYCYCGMLRRKR